MFSVQSQDFYFEPSDSLTKTISLSENSTLILDIIRSEEIDTLRLDYELITNTLPDEWYQSYCDNHGCYGNLPESGSMSPIYEGFEAFVKLYIGPNNVEGGGTVQYYIYESNHYENGLIMTFIMHTPDFVDVNDTIETTMIHYYPNPFRQQLHIQAIESNSEIRIYNLTGQTIYYKKSTAKQDIVINTEEWFPGIYLLNIINENGLRTTKRIIKK